MTADPFLDAPADTPQLPGRGRRWLKRAKWTGLVLLAIVILYYPVGMILIHRINDDPAFVPVAVQPGASKSVALAAALVQREVGDGPWPANDPFFLPGSALDNMPNYQKGMQTALARFAAEMSDQIGRSRGSSSADKDLTEARSSLNYAPDRWVWDPSISWWPTAGSEDQYMAAMRSLLIYNDRLSRGQAAFEVRADNLMATMDRIGKDLGAASNALDRQIDEHSGDWFDLQADDVFYLNKGQLYAYGLLLRDLGADFQTVIQEKGAATVWLRMVDSMLEGASLQPLVVMNGSPNAMLQPNHLAAQGFYLLRARTQLEEITDILQK